MLQPIFRKTDAVVFAAIAYQYIVYHKDYPVVSMEKWYSYFEVKVQVSVIKEEAEELANYLKSFCSSYCLIQVEYSTGAERWCVIVSVPFSL